MKQVLVLLSVLLATTSFADSLQKHPRVAELEDSLRDGASLYLKARFPERPFLVTVSVDPMRRITGKNSDSSTDLLPYFDAASDEIQDEWDDPQISLHQLVGRVNRISVDISIENALSDQEAQEVKEGLRSTLHLIDARDEIKFSYKNWSKSSDRWLYPFMALAISILFLFGFYGIQKSGVSKISQAISQSKPNSPLGGASGTSIHTAQSPNNGSVRADSLASIKGGMQLSDPIKAREIMANLIKRVCELPVFPTLSNLLYLEKFGKENPAGLGALMSEFPIDYQKSFYAIGTEDVWFSALNAPGTIGMPEVDVLQKIIRDATSAHSIEIEKMLISVWRLGDQLSDFIRDFPRDQALSILYQLPKGLGIRAARKAFPGAWAELLSPDFKVVSLSKEKTKEVLERAYKLKPLANFENLEFKRAEKELREYLTISSTEEEREIYLASRADSSIHRVRPPFYKVLEAEDRHLPEFCGNFTPEQWAFALFNVDRHLRKKIQSHLGEKQSFLLMEHIKKLDQTTPDPVTVGGVRELIASHFESYIISCRVQESQTPDEVENEAQAA